VKNTSFKTIALKCGVSCACLAGAWALEQRFTPMARAHADDSIPTVAPDTAPPPPLTPAESEDDALGGGSKDASGNPGDNPSPPAPPTESSGSELAEPAPEPAPSESPAAATAESNPQPQPPAAPADEEARAENVIAAKEHGWVPAYQLARPSWGAEVTASVAALGNHNLSPDGASGTARAVEIQAEYQFPFLQRIGVLSLGPSVALYPVIPSTGITSSVYSLWSAGGQARYQARFLREQILVPMVGYELQYLTYHFTDIQGSTTLQGPTFGAMLLLNWFEPSSASELYITEGISRSYLVGEYKMLSGSNGQISIDGGSIFFGLRFEF
jgi:hypothetical protein